MSERTLTAANEAIFQLQLNTNDAIRYIVKRSQCGPKEAGQAIKATVMFHKQH